MPDTDDITQAMREPCTFENATAARQAREAENADSKRESIEADQQRIIDDLREQLEGMRESWKDCQNSVAVAALSLPNVGSYIAQIEQELSGWQARYNIAISKDEEVLSELRADNQRLTEQVGRMRTEIRNFAVTIKTSCVVRIQTNWKVIEQLGDILLTCDAMTAFANGQPEAIDEAAATP